MEDLILNLYFQAPNEPFNLEMAISLAKNHEHETILYSEQSETITVPVTSMPSGATSFDGYQVIVMPSHDSLASVKVEDVKYSSNAKYPSNMNEVISLVLQLMSQLVMKTISQS